MSRPHQLVILRGGAAYTRAVVVDADTVTTSDGSTRFARLGRTVHVLPSASVVDIRAFDDEGSARRELRRMQQVKAGAGTREVAETVAVVAGRRGRDRPRSGAGSAVAESVHAVVTGERVAHVPRRKKR